MKTISEVKFTPGPYRLDQYGNVITPNGETLLITGVSMPAGYHPRMDEAKANTRLLCAAPELLEALTEVLAHRRDDKDGNYVMWIGEGTFLKCEAAITKATKGTA